MLVTTALVTNNSGDNNQEPLRKKYPRTTGNYQEIEEKPLQALASNLHDLKTTGVSRNRLRSTRSAKTSQNILKTTQQQKAIDKCQEQQKQTIIGG